MAIPPKFQINTQFREEETEFSHIVVKQHSWDLNSVLTLEPILLITVSYSVKLLSILRFQEELFSGFCSELFPSIVLCLCSDISCVGLFVTLWTIARLLGPWGFPSKNTGGGCHFLLQGVFLTQGSDPRLPYLLHCKRILYCLSHQGSSSCCIPETNNIYIMFQFFKIS